MVNPQSTAFKFSEKVGLLIGKGIRFMILGGVIVYLGGKLGRSNTTTNPQAR